MPQCPQHIAIIPDGNGRWAEDRKQPRTKGHHQGASVLRNIVSHCLTYPKIKALTVFAFSIENNKRPPKEIDFLMHLLNHELNQLSDELNENNIKIEFIGDTSRYSKTLLKKITQLTKRTQYNQGLVLTIALHYSGRWDLTEATKKLCQYTAEGTLSVSQINETLLNKYLALGHLPPPDLLIRTSGEQRISNFLLWQLAYTEFYFSPTYWPDFSTEQFDQAIHFFQTRHRRFGNIKSE